MLGQRTTSNNEHGRGITHKPLPSYMIRNYKSYARWNDSIQQKQNTYNVSIDGKSESGTIHSSSRRLNAANLSVSFDN
jgi:hypothetical protein